MSQGVRPSLNVFLATDGTEPPEGYADGIRVTRVPRAAGRPKGARFGTLVHLVLRDVEYDASANSIEAVTRTHGRIVDATDEEVRAAAQAVSACLRHPLIESARRSAAVHRELPIVVKTSADNLLDSVIDLAFQDDEGWVVVDFKTDAEDLLRLSKYRRQVGWYVRGLEIVTRQRPTGWLLHV